MRQRLVYGVCFKNGFVWRQIALGEVSILGCVKFDGGWIPGHVWLGYAVLAGLRPWLAWSLVRWQS